MKLLGFFTVLVLMMCGTAFAQQQTISSFTVPLQLSFGGTSCTTAYCIPPNIGTTGSITSSGTQSVTTTTVLWAPSPCGDGTVNLPASPVNNEPHTIINVGICLSNALTVSGNGHNIGVGSAIVSATPGSIDVRFSSAAGNWEVTGTGGIVGGSAYNPSAVAITGGTVSGLTSLGTVGPITIAPTASLATSLTTEQTGSGTNVSSPCINTPGWPFNCMEVTSDTSTPLTTGSNGVNAVLADSYKYGGNTDTAHCTVSIACSHTALWLYLEQTSATVGVAFDTVAFINGQFTAAGALNSGTPIQALYGIAVQANDSGGDHAQLTGGEIDVSLTATGTTRKTGWEVASAPLAAGNDSQLATWSSAYDAFVAGSCGTGSGPGGGGCAGFKYGFSFGRPDSYVPVTSSGTLITVTPGVGTASFATGIDFSQATFSNLLITSPNFLVTGAGEMQEYANNAAIQLWDAAGSSTLGGLVRIRGLGATNGFAFQVNTDSGNTFASFVTPWETNGGLMITPEGLTVGGTFNLSSISGAGSAAKYVCADSSGNVLIQSAAC